MGKIVVLFADKEEDFRHLPIRQIRRGMKNRPFEFLEASDVEEALTILTAGANFSSWITPCRS